MIFLFDRADAVEANGIDRLAAGRRHAAEGRSGWTTEVVSGPVVHLSLRGAPWPTESLARLRSGLVRVAATEGFSGDFLPRLMQQFRLLHPQIQF